MHELVTGSAVVRVETIDGVIAHIKTINVMYTMWRRSLYDCMHVWDGNMQMVYACERCKTCLPSFPPPPLRTNLACGGLFTFRDAWDRCRMDNFHHLTSHVDVMVYSHEVHNDY